MPNSDHRPKLAVIVPATDEPTTLGRCLEALERSSEPPDELVVVTEPARSGPAAARNRGAAETRSELVCFVDADVAVEPTALELLRDGFARRPDAQAIFGSYDDTPAAEGLVSRFRNLLHHHVHTSAPGPAETFWAGLGAVRRQSFDAAGGFDAGRYPEPSIEDIELGMRLRRAGAEIVLDPQVRGTHLKHWTLAQMVGTDFSRRGVPWLRLQLEAGEASGALNLSARNRASALAALALATSLAFRRAGPAGVALGAGVALNLPLYSLLWRRGGPGLVAAGIPLHLLHQLVAIAAVPAAVASHALARYRRG